MRFCRVQLPINGIIGNCQFNFSAGRTEWRLWLLGHLLSESKAENRAHGDYAEQKEHKRGLMLRRDLASAKQHIPYNEVYPRPHDIDRGRRQSASRWFRERSRKSVARNPVEKVRDHVCQERTGEEAEKVVVPA